MDTFAVSAGEVTWEGRATARKGAKSKARVLLVTVHVGRAGIVATVLALALPNPAVAQERRTMADHRARERVVQPVAPAVPQTRTRRIRDPVVWGLVSGAAGAAVGAVVGSAVDDSGYDLGWPAWLGGGMGMSLGVPLGVHLAYGADGPYAVTALPSLGIGAVGTWVAWESLGATGANGWPYFALAAAGTPAAQLLVSDYMEREYRDLAKRDEGAEPRDGGPRP